MAVALALFLTVYEGYRIIMPFVARDPLYHEVNFGQRVIDDWQYEGENEEGYLLFYNPTNGDRAMLPPQSRLFGADGKWVVIEHADAASLTYAEPLEAAPWYVYLLLLAAMGGSAWWAVKRVRTMRGKRMRVRPVPRRSSTEPFGVQRSRRRFKPRRSSRPS
ncbi:hypothetical protein [Alicyclobacillus acidocaldarius]|uniref:Uncharacterized protein n=1 Tax=Alicyclobacillus acidocaldarius (strain Tc-4-1) TaxID=1048834 RepID=F8ID44_ALIAT|nr:hypothetical protein [Alicyclobacillus acidocaldarius]AEJ42510.1 hypothetical protein TC41_0550 [Alicyclobacillus acidocaldarius subsp. acidocaldarius Tc-4-1]